MARAAAQFSSRPAPYSASSGSSYVIETREHGSFKDELPRVSNHVISPRASSNTEHELWKSSRLYERSSEYEDIYNRRFQREYPRNSGRYVRNSLKANRDGIRHWEMNGRLDPAHVRCARSMKTNKGTKEREERRNVGNRGHDGYVWKTKDRRDTTNREYLGVAMDGRDRIVTRNCPYVDDVRDIRDTRNPGDARNTSNNAENRENAVETSSSTEIPFSQLQWSPRQTSFPRKSVTTSEKSSTWVSTNNTANIDEIKPDITASSHAQGIPEPSNRGRNSPNCTTPPPIQPKPFRLKRETSRPDSPARSLASSTSDRSNVTHHSAASGKSEVSVKSILKKPRMGRVVLKEEPSSYAFLAVISCILCFPFGIYALVKSNEVKTAVEENDYDWALLSSKKVKNFCIGVTVAYLGILAIGGALLAKYFITGEII